MTRAAIVMLALVLAGCRPPAPPVPEAKPEPGRQEVVPHPVQPIESVKSVGVLENDAHAPVVAERGSTTPVAPPGVGASVTACEQSCGEVHDCAVLERMYTPATAASIELGCVRACLGTTERATLFGCARPSAIEPGACGQFLACIDSAWPQAGDAVVEIETPDANLRTDPCARGCDAFARCWNPATTAELIEQCAVECREALSAEEENRFGSCADLPECADINACVEATPNAT
jgi:hypothetical protein